VGVGQAGGTCFCGWGGNKRWWSNLRVTEVDFVTIVPKKKKIALKMKQICL